MAHKGYILDLGLIDYQKAWDLQHELWQKRVDGELPDLFLILEHPHVITLGRRGNRSFLVATDQQLEKMNVPIFHVERGGDVTYHGPGQIVGYPILNLKDYGYRLIRYVGQLEDVILSTLEDFAIRGSRNELNRGVWIGNEKIASIGVAIKRWVSFHGFALNYGTNLNYFDLIHPCGLEGIKMTSIEKVLGRKIDREVLTEKIVFHFRKNFQGEWEKRRLEEVYSKFENPSLRRQVNVE